STRTLSPCTRVPDASGGLVCRQGRATHLIGAGSIGTNVHSAGNCLTIRSKHDLHRAATVQANFTTARQLLVNVCLRAERSGAVPQRQLGDGVALDEVHVPRRRLARVRQRTSLFGSAPVKIDSNNVRKYNY